LLQLSCCSYLVAAILLQLSCCSYLVAAILLQLSCCSCLVAAVLLQLSCCSYLVAAILLQLSCCSYLVAAILCALSNRGQTSRIAPILARQLQLLKIRQQIDFLSISQPNNQNQSIGSYTREYSLPHACCTLLFPLPELLPIFNYFLPK